MQQSSAGQVSAVEAPTSQSQPAACGVEVVRKRKLFFTPVVKKLPKIELDVPETTTMGELYGKVAAKQDALLSSHLPDKAAELSSANFNLKFWTVIRGVSNNARFIHNVAGNKEIESQLVGSAFPTDSHEITLVKGPKIDEAQKAVALANIAQRNKEDAERQQAKRNQYLIDMSGYRNLGVKVAEDGTCTMAGNVSSSGDGANRDYLDCQFRGSDGGARGGGGRLGLAGLLGNFQVLGGALRRDEAQERRENEVARELAERPPTVQPRSEPQASWPPAMKTVEDDRDLSTIGALFDYARQEKVMRVIVQFSRSAAATSTGFLGSFAGDGATNRVLLAVRATVRMSRGSVDQIVQSDTFCARDIPLRPGGSQEVYDGTSLQQFRTVWNRVFTLEGGARGVDLTQPVTADMLIEEYARLLGGGFTQPDDRGYIHREGRIARNGENDEAFATGRTAIRKFFKAYGGSDGTAMALSTMQLTAGKEAGESAGRVAHDITGQVNALLPRTKDAALDLEISGYKIALLRPNLQYSVDERSYGEYLYWAEMKADYERTEINPVELPQWGYRTGHKTRILGSAESLFPRDRVGIDPRNGHFFSGFGEAGARSVTLFTTVGATEKTRAKLGLVILGLLGRLEGPEKENHKVVREFMESIRGDEGRRPVAGMTVEQQADSAEEDPWGNPGRQIDLPTLEGRYLARVTHYQMTMDAALNAHGVRKAELTYTKPAGMGFGSIARFKVYQGAPEGRNITTIFEVDSDTWSSDKSFHLGGHAEFGIGSF